MSSKTMLIFSFTDEPKENEFISIDPTTFLDVIFVPFDFTSKICFSLNLKVFRVDSILDKFGRTDVLYLATFFYFSK